MYYSQHGEDKWIVENLKLPETCTFVEVGAFDGVQLSNTKHFEDKGWTGLVIEPDPRQWGSILMNRTCKKFFGAAGPERLGTFDMAPIESHSGFGRGGDRIQVPVMTLDRLLNAHDLMGSDIDLLSLDTEGTELDVWDSGEFSDIGYPRVVIIEWETAGLPSNEAKIMEHFAPLPYKLVHRNVGNLIFELK